MPDWHHAPLHRLGDAGAYCVTAGTYLKERLFHTRKQLDMLQELFFDCAERFQWRLQSWSFFSNHYHFVAFSPENAGTLSRMINELHSASARELNRMEGQPGRKVWFQFWETHLTIQGLVPRQVEVCPRERRAPSDRRLRNELPMVLGVVVRAEREQRVLSCGIRDTGGSDQHR